MSGWDDRRCSDADSLPSITQSRRTYCTGPPNRHVQSLLFRLSGAASTIPAASIGERQWRLPSLQSNTCVLVSHFDDFPYSNIPIPYRVSIRWQGER